MTRILYGGLAAMVGAAALSVTVLAGAGTVPAAAMNGDREAVRQLLKQGADVNAVQGDGVTALHWAATRGDADMAAMLLVAGANHRAATRFGGYMPLHVAAERGYAAVVIITNVAGRPYQDYIKAEIMRPLGMTSTSYDIFASPSARRAIGYRFRDGKWQREPDMKDGEYGAMGGVETSANDYWHWIAFLLSAWPPRDGPETGPVKRSTVREIVTGSNFARGSNRSPTISAEPCRVAVAYAMAGPSATISSSAEWSATAAAIPDTAPMSLFSPTRASACSPSATGPTGR